MPCYRPETIDDFFHKTIARINSFWHGSSHDGFEIHSLLGTALKPCVFESEYGRLAEMDYVDWHSYLLGSARVDSLKNSLVSRLLSHLNKDRESLSYSICTSIDCPLHCAQVQEPSALTKFRQSKGAFPFPVPNSSAHFMTLCEYLCAEPPPIVCADCITCISFSAY
jgi:hypothetical protein